MAIDITMVLAMVLYVQGTIDAGYLLPNYSSGCPDGYGISWLPMDIACANPKASFSLWIAKWWRCQRRTAMGHAQ